MMKRLRVWVLENHEAIATHMCMVALLLLVAGWIWGPIFGVPSLFLLVGASLLSAYGDAYDRTKHPKAPEKPIDGFGGRGWGGGFGQ